MPAIAKTLQNNPAPTTVNVDDLIYSVGKIAYVSSGSPNTYAQGYIDAIAAVILTLQTVRDAAYTSSPPVGTTTSSQV